MKSLQDFVRELSALSFVPTGDSKEFIETLAIYAVLAYSEGRSIEIPMLGTIDLEYDGDTLSSHGRVAKVKSTFTPDPFLVRCVGQIHDKEETDAERIYKDKIERLLKKHQDS